MSQQPQRTALIFGATGAVGKELLKDLLQNSKYAKIVSLGRRNVQLEESIPQEKLVQKTIDFENLEASREDFKNVSDVYCCLGTTRADAGGAEQFKKIDQAYVLNSAKLIAEENKTTESTLAPVHFLYCSAKNANANSYFLYPKTKGETEQALEETGFEKVSIFRPFFLETVEERTRPRFGERVIGAVYKPIDRFFGLGTWINVATVGKAMHQVAENYSSIEPSEKRSSTIGSLVTIFSNEDTEKIELDPLAFTVELGDFYEKSKTAGTVAVTMKRMTASRLLKASKVKKAMPKGGDAVVNSTNPDDVQYPCIVRAIYKKKKISTIIAPEDFDRFQNAYSTIIRAYMDTLKKKDRSKKVKKTTK